MTKQKLKIGDKVRVIRYRPIKVSPRVAKELGTEKLFKAMVGRRYIVKGFGKYGHVELEPKRLHTVWIDPDLVRLVQRKPAK
jgi:hypothetical protein